MTSVHATAGKIREVLYERSRSYFVQKIVVVSFFLTMIKVLFIRHGNKLLFGKNVGKLRVVGFGKRIFIPDL